MGKFDEIFDDVVVNAKAAASVVSKKASAVCDASKQKINAAEIRGEINKKLRDLGALTYKSVIHDIDLSEQTAQTVAEITDLKDNLNSINEHIAAAKNIKKCPQCASSVPKNSLFCNICGAKIEDDFVSQEDEDIAEEVADEVIENMESAKSKVAEEETSAKAEATEDETSTKAETSAEAE